MRRGKQIAQGAHASMSALVSGCWKPWPGAPWMRRNPLGSGVEPWEDMIEWLGGALTKICVRVDSEEELLEITKKAEEAGLPTALITDSGKTEFHGVPTTTCVAIGPAKTSQIDKITGELRLL